MQCFDCLLDSKCTRELQEVLLRFVVQKGNLCFAPKAGNSRRGAFAKAVERVTGMAVCPAAVHPVRCELLSSVGRVSIVSCKVGGSGFAHQLIQVAVVLF